MVKALILKLRKRDRLSEEECKVLERAVARIRDVSADEDIVREGDRPTESSLIVEGFAARYKVTPSGRRQITEIHVAGDFVDLHSFLLKTMDHNVLALSRCRIAHVPHGTLQTVTENHPHLTRLLWLSTLIDSAIHREWMTAMGRRTAAGQFAHLLCELFIRLQIVELTRGAEMQLPLTQAELGDTLGLSTVHVNRMLQELRGDGLVTWHGATVTILDWDRLARLAEFSPTYLNLQSEPR